MAFRGAGAGVFIVVSLIAGSIGLICLASQRKLATLGHAASIVITTAGSFYMVLNVQMENIVQRVWFGIPAAVSVPVWALGGFWIYSVGIRRRGIDIPELAAGEGQRVGVVALYSALMLWLLGALAWSLQTEWYVVLGIAIVSLVVFGIYNLFYRGKGHA